MPVSNHIIAKLRVQGADSDPDAVRVRATALLNSADLRPPSLPPCAILCVLSLADPLPGALRLDGGSMRPAAAWEQALARQLELLGREAARPVAEPVPVGAKAILFRDEAELLACLANDWCDGAIGRHWWWGMLAPGEPGAAVLRAWNGAPQAIPAALAHLSRKRRAVQFVRALQPPDASLLTNQLLSHYALQGLSATLAAVPGSEHAPAPQQHSSLMSAYPIPLAPWQHWAAEADGPGLSLAGRLLLGLGLTLHRAPMTARSSAFAHQLAEWAAAVNGIGPQERHAPATGDPALAAAQRQAAAIATDTVARAEDERLAVAGAAGGQGNERVALQATLVEEAPGWTGAPYTHTAPGVQSSQSLHTLEAVDSSGASSYDFSGSDKPDSSGEMGGLSEPLDTPSAPYGPYGDVHTCWGGVLYLLNVALYLELYSDFSGLPGHDLSLAPWDFIALVGEQLAGAKLKRDLIWELLAHLAMRGANVGPGQGFQPPQEWRIPAGWLAPFADTPRWRWTVQDERLYVAHPAGFCLLDLPVSSDPQEQLARETSLYKSTARLLFSVNLRPPAGTPLQRWTAWVGCYMQARLRRALGGGAGRNVGRFVCRHDARITITETHVIAALRLDALPVQLRIAGLDRDPGWIPAAGRSVSFVFE